MDEGHVEVPAHLQAGEETHLLVVLDPEAGVGVHLSGPDLLALLTALAGTDDLPGPAENEDLTEVERRGGGEDGETDVPEKRLSEEERVSTRTSPPGQDLWTSEGVVASLVQAGHVPADPVLSLVHLVPHSDLGEVSQYFQPSSSLPQCSPRAPHSRD